MTFIRKILFFFICSIAFPIYAIENSGEIFYPREALLIPQTVFVGDRGRLVVSLGPEFEIAESGVFFSDFPELQDIVFQRMELEKRNNNIRLLIDFIPYAPGLYNLPLLRIPVVDSEPLFLGGLDIAVASVLSPDLMVLSQQGLPLAVPGTGLFVYGGAGIIIFILILALGGLFWVHRYLGPLQEKLKCKRLLASLEQKLGNLRSCENDLPEQKELFSLLAGEFRDFLSFITGINCRVLSPQEFLTLPASINTEKEFLCSLFRRWDNLRFSGMPIIKENMLELLDELATFLTELNNQKPGEKGSEV